ncbi:hydroxyacylglutathione hydrolase [Rhodovulum sp. ES.010]|uniref:hydroxyacylglutathione hydrolase n=1 Tax=Rhodovulum sp. ES.010 TaxID=1882821 RepID=UPI000925ABAB|nr:hydroxyacylglutathione hydrolase [Rhodovulum sp. ES.010]SIO45629.1 hydroxyacylglutathione hydrolase [Rhodovulum sp. ES.010]
MPLEIVTVPCLSDNYAYLLHDADSGATAVVDAPEAEPVEAALAARGWRLTDILITHHHHDHIGGVEALRDAHGARVVGAAADAHRLPPLDLAVAEGDSVAVGGETGRVLDVSGHTVGHIAYHFPGTGAVFTADSLMALGCGRVFEGTPEMMWQSLSRLAALPADTLVYSGHEYTAKNAEFALTVEPDNPALNARAEEIGRLRAEGTPTVPARLSEEIETNPFLRADRPEVKAAVGLADASDAEVFAEIRARKDRF